jgi:hypothetical protein
MIVYGSVSLKLGKLILRYYINIKNIYQSHKMRFCTPYFPKFYV